MQHAVVTAKYNLAQVVDNLYERLRMRHKIVKSVCATQ